MYVRAVGPHPLAYPSGQIGTQYVVWTAETLNDLPRCERVLKVWSAYRTTRNTQGFTLVEGRNPSGLRVKAYPARTKSHGLKSSPAIICDSHLHSEGGSAGYDIRPRATGPECWSTEPGPEGLTKQETHTPMSGASGSHPGALTDVAHAPCPPASPASGSPRG